MTVVSKTSRKKVYDCNLCGLDTNNYVNTGNLDSEILIVRDFPATTEIQYKNYFATTEGRYLKQSLEKAEIDLSKCYFTYTLLCNLPKPPRANLPIDQIKSCGSNLINLIQTLPNLKLIVTCGEYGFKFFSNKSQLKKHRGEMFKKDKLNIFSVFDPKYILTNKQEEKTFINDLIKAHKIVNGEIKAGQDIKFLLCKTTEDLDYAKQKLNEAEYYAFDIETLGGEYGLDAFSPNNKIMTIGFTTDKLESFCIPIDHPEALVNVFFTKIAARKYLDEALHNNSKRVGHNARFDVRNLMKLLDLSSIDVYFDTMLASSILNQGNGNSNSLKRLAIEHLGYAENYSVLEEGVENDKISLGDLARYNCEDTHNTILLYRILNERLKEEELSDLFYDIVMPGNEVLTDIELNGSKIDTAYGNKLLVKYEENKKTLMYKLQHHVSFHSVIAYGKTLHPERKNEIDSITYENKEDSALYKSISLCYEMDNKTNEVNINSNDSLATYIYDTLGLKCPKLTETGKRSTDVESLNRLSNHPFVADLLLYKKYEKAIGTYITPLIQVHLKYDSKIHCNYNQAVTTTGRLSSNSPNLQNVPSRGEMGKDIKKLFVPSEVDWVLLQADYSQVELRMAAILANEPVMLDAYANDKDIHRITAATVLNKDIKDITDEDRQKAKAVAFGFLYGGSAQGFVGYAKKSYGVDFTLEQAEQVRNKFFRLYSALPKWYEKIWKDCRRNNYVKSLFGRKRIIDNINSKNSYLRGAAERQSINHPDQGSCADMLLLALYHINRYLKEKNIRAKIINTVHDSIILECHKDDLMRTAKIVKTIMENIPTPFEKLCPIKAELEYGPNWGELQKLKF